MREEMKSKRDKEGYLKTDRQTLEHPISGDFPEVAQPLYTMNEQIVLEYPRRNKAKEKISKTLVATTVKQSRKSEANSCWRGIARTNTRKKSNGEKGQGYLKSPDL